MTEADLNKLVVCDNHIGIIKYVGPVHELKDNKEIWYGIEWRDESRGKHDGSYQGTRYFNTKYATNGSFVRPSKVEFGTDIQTAVANKYLEQDEIDNGEEKCLYNNFNVKDKAIMINQVNLAYCKINESGDLKFLKETFPYMKELDLEGNLFTCWSHIFSILDQLNDLKLINLSNNTMSIPEQSKFSFDVKNVYPNIQHLIINRMNYTWSDIQQVLKHFPNLVELKVCFNSIDKIESVDVALLRKVKILDLESNPINEWNDLKKIGSLTELETLYANEIGLSTINFNEVSDLKTDLFPKLKVFSLNDNKINDWKSINELRKLPKLEALVIKFNPLNNTDSVENFRQLIIAKLPDMKMFNRTVISNGERKGSEIDYLKKFGQEWIKITENPDDTTPKLKFLKEHTSYLKLIEKYGAAEKSEVVIQDETMKSSLIWLNIKDESSGKVLRRKLPLTADVQRLRFIMIKLFKYHASDSPGFDMFYTTGKPDSDEYELDNDLRTLDFYSLEQDNIIILRKNRTYQE